MLNRLALTGQAHRISGSRVKKLKSCILWVVKSVRGGGAGAGGGTKTGHGGPGARVADVTPAREGGGEQVVVVESLAKAPDDRQESRPRIKGDRDRPQPGEVRRSHGRCWPG